MKLRFRPSRDEGSSQSRQRTNTDGTFGLNSSTSSGNLDSHESTNNNSNSSNRNNRSNRITHHSPKRQKARKVLSILDSPRRAILARASSSKRKQLKHRRMEGSDVPDLKEEKNNRSNLNMEEFNDSDVEMMDENMANVLSWLHDEAPSDVLPKILSFAGTQKVQILSTVNKSWRSMCLAEGVWRTLCEDTRKWVPGRDPEPQWNEILDKDLYWKQYYRDNPIVPLDFPSLHGAMASVSTQTVEKEPEEHKSKKHIVHDMHPRNVRIFLQPGQYNLKTEVLVQTHGNTELTIETLEDPPQKEHEIMQLEKSQNNQIDEEQTMRKKRIYSSTFRDFLTCRTGSCSYTSNEESISEHNRLVQRFGLTSNPKLATIVLKSRRHDEPIFHIRQGTLRLSKLLLVHCSPGTDIWNGNTAVQVQPQFQNDRPIQVQAPDRPPTAVVDQTDIVSLSGRGIVAIDGGFTTIRKTFIHNCAATGLYVGGPGSTATVEESDILNNGNGNRWYRHGIARGHSGIYLEQGTTSMTNCNISLNSLTGISAVSRTNAFLTLVDSDLMGNGTMQLEMPPLGTESRNKSLTRNNNMSNEGSGRNRSGLVPFEKETESRDGALNDGEQESRVGFAARDTTYAL